ncbi:MAG: GTPase Era [Lysobacterales bacterium CG02_land_8_20_14_3_00_62_12]|nr:MAG: GTPase Era [Xanthomonadales bacterium CG02_land_8_20_14_3_00_62_12]PJA40421.1 MAG: GTPase Era [Xanthomonadales bacterium CG_4_9_14_3_um_filter_62_6]
MTATATPVSRFATIAVAGRPNVGKSTLLNALIGYRLCITASKPQTTRHRMLGIMTRPNAQIAFIDTPGIHGSQPRALNRALNRTAKAAIDEADLVLWVIEAPRQTAEDDAVGAWLKDLQRPLVIALNKIDRLPDKSALLPLLIELQARYQPQAMVPVSALKTKGIEQLRGQLIALSPVGEAQFNEDELTDRSEKFLAAERVREQVVRLLRDELPFATTVEIEGFERVGNLLRLAAVIWVEREGQKAIVIGKGGAQLKTIGTQARMALESLFDCKVHLETWVRVRNNWSDDERSLRGFGLDQV